MTALTKEKKGIYLRWISLANVRCFKEKQEFKFLSESGKVARWNIIIGNNGVGKTTILRTIAFSILAEERFSIQANSFFNDFRYFYSNNGFLPTIMAAYGEYWNSLNAGKTSMLQQLNLSQTRGGFVDTADYKKLPVCIGYGASRRIGDSAISEEKSNYSAANLFDDEATLINAEEWLVEADYRAAKSDDGHFSAKKEKVISILKKLFRGEVHDFKIDLEGKRPKAKFKTDYGWVNLHDLSLGYKTLIAWMTDFASRMFEEYPDSDDPLAEPAVVLVDEIDLHLHPQFQRELTSFLTETFPKTQFIVTAHSPLILQSAPDANVILLKKEGDHVVVKQNPHEIKNWRIDQLLTSDLYGLPSARPPETEQKIERRRSLIKNDHRTSAEEAELEILEKELVELPVGETPEAIKAMEIIQKAAKHYEKQQNGKH